MFEEITNAKGHILFWQPDIKYRVNSTRILGMDLDWTFIKPIKGKIYPIDEYDWEFLTPDLRDLLKIKQKITDVINLLYLLIKADYLIIVPEN